MGRWIRSERPRSDLGSEEGETPAAHSSLQRRHCRKAELLAGVCGSHDSECQNMKENHQENEELTPNSPRAKTKTRRA